MSFLDLKSKWNKEKTSYIKKEVGDGVQKFVKEILACPEIFNLKQGLNSTPLENRKDEFKEEEVKKAARRADVVIFINPEIVIPLEIEKYQNIQAGEKQIVQYQLDWDKRYGILTDGYTWRFYNNNEYREFILKDIFDKTDEFLGFWNEYVKPEFYYLAFFEKKGQQSLLKESEILHVEGYRQLFFDDITKLIRGFKNKLGLEGYLTNIDKKNREKTAVEITYAYIIQFILYKTLVDNDFGKFKKEFNERQQSIYECLKANRFGEILGVIDGISNQISENIYRKFSQEQEFINSKLLELIRQPKNELHDVSPWLDIFVFIKKYNFANVRNEIFGYIYENYLKALYEDTKKGQYFTDPAVVNFMLDMVGYTAQGIKNSLGYDRYGERGFDNHISIIDPSCGCGTFLYSAVDRIIAGTGYGSEKASIRLEHLISQSVFGLDIEEFPLYLAEMNILMRMLPMILHKEYSNPFDEKIKVFKTNDSVAEFLDTAIKNTLNDIEVEYKKSNGQMSLFTQKLNLGYQSYVRDEDDLADMKKSLENHSIPRRRFDFVIGNPPYVSYNECSKAGLLTFKLIKDKASKIKLNDIYGMNLHSIPNHRKKYSPKPNLYAFFIALGIALLKDGAKICYIVPQTLLTAGDLDVLRYHLAKFTTLEKIITFSGKMFIGRGLKQDKPVATSSLVFVASRRTPDIAHEVEVINYKNPDDDIEKCLSNILAYNHKEIDYRKILQNKLLQNVANWNFIKQDKKTLDFCEEYKKNTDDILIYYDHATAEHYLKSRFYFDKGLVFPKNSIKKTIADSNYFNLVKLQNGRYGATLNGKVIQEKNIKIPHGSQGIELFRKKYKILWSYMNYNGFHFSDEKIMVNFNFVIISSDNKKELLYLLSLLNSSLITYLFNTLLKSENEKDILIGIKTIKEFVRVPKITERNQFIKDEIIKITEEMLHLEDVRLSDLVDFSKIMMQKFEDVSVKDGCLILEKDKKQTRLKIKDSQELVEWSVKNVYKDNKLKLDNKEQISLSELKNLLVIDFDKQRELKNYIDDLVFALYFNTPIKKVSLDKADKIKQMCMENKFYNLKI